MGAAVSALAFPVILIEKQEGFREKVERVIEENQANIVRFEAGVAAESSAHFSDASWFACSDPDEVPEGAASKVACRGRGIFAYHLKQPACRGRPRDRNFCRREFTRRYTILYSHGNGETVGTTIRHGSLKHLSERTGCDIFAYEYLGYTGADRPVGAPSESGCYDSINAAYDYLTKTLGVPPETIIIYGRSIGSGPSVDLASRVGKGGAAGLILEAPLTSGARVMWNNEALAWIGSSLDIFKNIEKIDRVEVPGCVMHGEADAIVPVSHGRELFSRMRARHLMDEADALWLSERGHNDLPMERIQEHASEFIARVVERQGYTRGKHAVMGR